MYTREPAALPAKAMHYCHDTFGLGDLGRTLTFANHLQASIPTLTQLIATGSPAVQDRVLQRSGPHG